MKQLFGICVYVFLSISVASANDMPSIVKTNAKGQEKTSFELLAEIKGIVDTLEEKDSLSRFSYMDYCLDSILLPRKDNREGLYLARQICEDSFVYFFSSKQKELYVKTILEERYYDLCFWNLDMDWGPVYGNDCICKLLIKNESDEILDSVRNAREKLTKVQCENCSQLDHKLFYRELLLGLHDNSQIDSLFQNMITASKSKKEMEIINEFLPGLYMEWFKYRKVDLFDVVYGVIRDNKKAYYRNEFYSRESSAPLISYVSFDSGIIDWLKREIVDFPQPNRNDRIRSKFKGKDYYTFSDEYKQEVIKWMKEHRSDYVIREE